MHTGVASEIASLRLQALQVLAEIGTKENAAFLRHLNTGAHNRPLFDEQCQEAMQSLETR
jgi:hypothetical protein